MKKSIFPLLLVLCLTLSACGVSGGEAPSSQEGDTLTIAATTYPVYLFTRAVVGEMEGVKVSAVINQPMSCLHDYTLSVGDMKIIEGADVIVMNGVGLEDFMDDALAAFDQERMERALDLLVELSQEEQILFFTCQSREGAYLAHTPGVERVALNS